MPDQRTVDTALPRHPDTDLVAAAFDARYYCSCFPPSEVPADPLQHFLYHGWREGRDPTTWFSTRHYLATYEDIREAGVNPFVHYVSQGQTEVRILPQLGRNSGGMARAHAFATSPGPLFEEPDPGIGQGLAAKALVLAYYLPQFHAIRENDLSWGTGFTEWRNLPRGLPRFVGHIQPRIPRDLGHYTLAEGDIYHRQIALARAAGIGGFCFYHYWFDGTRVLDRPINRMLADPSADFPFCLMWANENWTRTWDGFDRDVILSQSYRPEDDAAFLADLARHFDDPRYIRIDGRPLFFIYRPNQIPEPVATIARWRQKLMLDHGHDPLIFMAQGFGDSDPRLFGLDGAIEFPPHKICQDLPNISPRLEMLDPEFSGVVMDYDTAIQRSLDVPVPEFPLIRTVAPSWDNEARRPGRGLTLAGSTPDKFQRWLADMIRFAQENPVQGQAIVAINAWNEWAESAMLEPDVHYGGAYLNAASRAIFGVDRQIRNASMKVVLVGHDAHRSGAQMLLLNIGKMLVSRFGVEVVFLLHEGGAIENDYRAVARTEILPPDPAARTVLVSTLRAAGFHNAILNTTVSGGLLPQMKRLGMHTVVLVHELRNVIDARNLAGEARDIAQLADHVIFPADVVRESFLGVSGPLIGTNELLPQGLYSDRLMFNAPDRALSRAHHGIGLQEKLVICVGYADLRKGIDRFIETAIRMCRRDPDLRFVWVGTASAEASEHHIPLIAEAGLADRIQITGRWEDPAAWYAAADLYYLTSREDPFPSVVIEALAVGLPLVGYAGTGGCDDLVRRHGQLLPAQAQGPEIDDAILYLLMAQNDGPHHAARMRRADVRANFRFDNYCFELLRRLDPCLPKVSVAIPNYNYERYIAARMQTVFDQSLPVFETLVLDDASTDGSVGVITETAERKRRTIALSVNARNSGSPFPQWRKAALQARGDYLWICEADDVADPGLLDALARRMDETNASLGFCDSWQIDSAGDKIGESYRPYLNEIEPGAFDTSFEMAGSEFLARYLAIKNVILNVSGVLFRRNVLLAAMDAAGPEFEALGVAGDWRLYIEICAMGGKVCYLADPMNGHRRHAHSVTTELGANRHIEEVEKMQALARNVAPVSREAMAAQQGFVMAAKRYLGLV